MKFDRLKFFSHYKHEFGSVTELQVQGLERLLAGYETFWGWWDNPKQIANSLTQVGHETAHSFHPVVEGYYLAKNVPADLRYFQGDYDVVRRFQKTLRYYPDFGRGDIQYTWLTNYQKADALLRRYFPEIVEDFELRTGQKFDLIHHPEQMLDGKISFCAMTVGMHLGTFTQHKLDDYILPDGNFDHFNARSIVNGDKNYKNKQGKKLGDVMARTARKFEKVLEHSLLHEVPLKDASVHIDSVLAGNVPMVAELKAVNPNTAFQPPAGGEEPQEPGDSNVSSSAASTSIAAAAAGDKPLDEPRVNIQVEDWKPWVFSKLKWTWTSFTGVNFTQSTANGIAALKSGEYWYVPLIIWAATLIITFIVCALLSLTLLAIWYFNRKEITHFLTERLKSLTDPQRFNLGLKFDTKY